MSANEGASKGGCLNITLNRSDTPLVTVITAVFNGAETIRQCIESVLRQDYPFIEHIIVDGGSTDGTVDVLRQYEDRIALWTSEPDSGVYDAWNKGVRSAHGEWVAFLGADDRYLPDAIRTYVEYIRHHPGTEFLSSVVRLEYPSGHFRDFGECWQWLPFLKYMSAAHPGSMHKRSLFARYGFYDTSYRITADYEFLLRAGPDLKAAFMPITTVAMRAGGISDSFRALREASRARVETGGQSAVRAATELCVAVLKRVARKAFVGLRAKLPA
jgi:glycosyltransferase involved in cell wall biosynthesis